MQARLIKLSIATFFALLAFAILRELWVAYGAIHPYKIGDWQINYAGGFVRRGLLGELARQLLTLFAIDTRNTVVFIEGLSYLVFFVGGYFLVAPVVARFPIFAFSVFSPLVFSFGAVDPAACGRKEIVYLATLVLQALWLLRQQSKPTPPGRLLLGLSALFLLQTLMHEMLVMFVPFQILLAVMLVRTPISAWKWALAAAPAALAFLLSAAFKGDQAHVAAICASLGSSAPPRCETNGAIAWLAISTIDALRAMFYLIVQPPFMLVTTVASALLGAVPLALLALHRGIAERLRGLAGSRLARQLVVLCVITPLPLFVIGSDHGRWLHIWFASATIVLAAILHAGLQAEKPVAARPDAAPGAASGPGLPFGRLMWFVLFAAYALSWHAPGVCCPDKLGGGFLGQAFTYFAQNDTFVKLIH